MNKDNEKFENEIPKNEVEEIEEHNELDKEALDVIFRLYDKTIKDLVDR